MDLLLMIDPNLNSSSQSISRSEATGSPRLQGLGISSILKVQTDEHGSFKARLRRPLIGAGLGGNSIACALNCGQHSFRIFSGNVNNCAHPSQKRNHTGRIKSVLDIERDYFAVKNLADQSLPFSMAHGRGGRFEPLNQKIFRLSTPIPNGFCQIPSLDCNTDHSVSFVHPPRT
jgi:hypothetical protein